MYHTDGSIPMVMTTQVRHQNSYRVYGQDYRACGSIVRKSVNHRVNTRVCSVDANLRAFTNVPVSAGALPVINPIHRISGVQVHQ